MNEFLLLVIVHFISDFILQKWGIGSNKRGLNKYMILHILITTLCFVFVCLLLGFTIKSTAIAGVLILISHITIDIVRQEIHAKYKLGPNNDWFWTLLGFDQILHILFIYLAITQILYA